MQTQYPYCIPHDCKIKWIDTHFEAKQTLILGSEIGFDTISND